MFQHPNVLDTYMHERVEDLHELALERRVKRVPLLDHHGIGQLLAVPAHALAARLHHHVVKPAANAAPMEIMPLSAFLWPGATSPSDSPLPMAH